MSANNQSFESVGKLHIDRGFSPDITRRGLPQGVLGLMESFGMLSIGTPVLGMPPMRHALWFGTKPNTYIEIPVVMVASRTRVPDISAAWFCGVASAEPDYLCPSDDTTEKYSRFAVNDAASPENALVRSLVLLEGPSAVPPNLKETLRGNFL